MNEYLGQEFRRLLSFLIQKNKELHQIADEVEEEVIKIQPIYEAIKEHPEADKEEIYKMLK